MSNFSGAFAHFLYYVAIACGVITCLLVAIALVLSLILAFKNIHHWLSDLRHECRLRKEVAAACRGAGDVEMGVLSESSMTDMVPNGFLDAVPRIEVSSPVLGIESSLMAPEKCYYPGYLFIEGAPNNPKTPLENRQSRGWPRTKAESDQLFVYIILGILALFFMYNICVCLHDRRQARNRERRRQQHEAEMDDEAEAEEIEQSRNKVIAWIEVNETVSKPPSPIDINRPKYQSLVPTSAQPDIGARAQRPKARRSESAPLLRKHSTDSELHFLYDTFGTPCQGANAKRKSEAHMSDRHPARELVTNREATIKPTVSIPIEPSVDLDDVAVHKKHVSFAANDEVLGSSWSTVLSGSAPEEQRSTSKKQVSFAVHDEEIVRYSSHGSE